MPKAKARAYPAALLERMAETSGFILKCAPSSPWECRNSRLPPGWRPPPGKSRRRLGWRRSTGPTKRPSIGSVPPPATNAPATWPGRSTCIGRRLQDLSQSTPGERPSSSSRLASPSSGARRTATVLHAARDRTYRESAAVVLNRTPSASREAASSPGRKSECPPNVRRRLTSGSCKRPADASRGHLRAFRTPHRSSSTKECFGLGTRLPSFWRLSKDTGRSRDVQGSSRDLS